MVDLDVICSALWAVAPMYLAIRRATRRGHHEPRPRPVQRPVTALLFLGIAIWLSMREDLATAMVIAFAAWTAVASVMVLLVPARPRLARLLALLAPGVAAIAMLCAGGCHGA
jgi:hypothetical protein